MTDKKVLRANEGKNHDRKKPYTRKGRGDPLRNNPVVGFMSETQAEQILQEMRENNE